MNSRIVMRNESLGLLLYHVVLGSLFSPQSMFKTELEEVAQGLGHLCAIPLTQASSVSKSIVVQGDKLTSVRTMLSIIIVVEGDELTNMETMLSIIMIV